MARALILQLVFCMAFVLQLCTAARKCYKADGRPSQCVTRFVNAAYLKDIAANNTCGLNGPSNYFVQRFGSKKVCKVCDSGTTKLAHSARNMNDFKTYFNPTWWQSDTLLDNKYPVRIILNLGKTFDITYVRITFHSPRPQSFAIYKKSSTASDAKWIPFQYYSQTCTKTYRVPPFQIVSKNNQKIALCSDKYSEITPMSGGNVAFSTLEGRPGRFGFDSSPVLQEWVTVASLRIDLDQLNTFGDEVFGDPDVLRSYYYSISNVVVGGRCKCNGHAAECIEGATSGGKKRLRCKCEHNTDGEDCHKCLPLYNDTPWKKATRRSGNPCSPCNCNGLADSCIFDQELYRATGRGGRCVNCKNNTDGVNCERCKIYHYRKFANEACKPCNCDPLGSKRPQCNADGQCTCQPGVFGKKCDKCRPGYFGFSKYGCKPCKCSKQGSVSQNCDATGKCQCKKNVVGQKCDQCKEGNFDLDDQNTEGCKPCFCYGHGISCFSQSGFERDMVESTFKNGLEGWRVENYAGVDFQSSSNFYLKGQQIRVTAPISGEVLYLVAPKKYLGNRLSSYGRNFTFVMGVTQVQKGWNNTKKDFILEGSGLKAEFPINSQGNVVPRARFVTYTFTMKEPKGMNPFLFQKLLSRLTAIKLRMTYGGSVGVIGSVSMVATKAAPIDTLEQVSWVEQCTCQKGYTGIQCEKCDNGYTRTSIKEGKFGKNCIVQQDGVEDV